MFSTFSTRFSTIKRDQPYTHRNSGSRFLESFGRKCRHSAFYKKESRRIFFAFYKLFPSGDLFFSNLEWTGPKFSTPGRCRFSVWKRRGKLQFSTPEKAAACGNAGSKLPQSRCARQIPLFVAARHLFLSLSPAVTFLPGAGRICPGRRKSSSGMGPLAVRKSFRLKCKACGTPEAPSQRELAKPIGFD